MITSALDEQAQKVTGEALQDALVDLIDLSLVAKQAHWTVVGRNFRSIHLQLDEVVELARRFTDTVAERAAALGHPPDGRARTVAERTGVPQLPVGWQQDTDVVHQFVQIHRSVVERMRERITVTEHADPVTQDLFIGLTAELEKQSWMFQAEQ